MVTSEKIDIACNYSKLQYSKMDELIKSEKMGEIAATDKFIIMYDMSYAINLLESICGFSKESGHSDSDFDNLIVVRLAYGMLNSVAHYRHYITSRVCRGSVLVVYSSDPELYTRYAKTFSMMTSILNLFRKTIFIEKMDQPSKFMYQHIAYFTAMNISTLNLNSGDKRCRVMYIGSNPLAFQMLRIDRDMIHIKHNHVECGTDIFFNNPDILKIPHTGVGLNPHSIDLITTVLSTMGFRNGFPRLTSFKGKKTSNIYNVMLMNNRNYVDKDNPSEILKGISVTQSDIDLLGLRLKSIDVDYQNNTYALSKQLLKIWSSKVHSKSLHSFNDIFEFDDLTLNIQWLIG